MSEAYELIKAYYGDKAANRSQVPLMNHIDEGIIILKYTRAAEPVIDAYCLHPLVQDDDALKDNWFKLSAISDSCTVMYAMEYRSVANEYLSAKVNTGHKIRLSPLAAVNLMLVADKIQNRKDFIKYHRGTHPRSRELDRYFDDWMHVLGIDTAEYEFVCEVIDKEKKNEHYYPLELRVLSDSSSFVFGDP